MSGFGVLVLLPFLIQTVNNRCRDFVAAHGLQNVILGIWCCTVPCRRIHFKVENAAVRFGFFAVRIQEISRQRRFNQNLNLILIMRGITDCCIGFQINRLFDLARLVKLL